MYLPKGFSVAELMPSLITLSLTVKMPAQYSLKFFIIKLNSLFIHRISKMSIYCHTNLLAHIGPNGLCIFYHLYKRSINYRLCTTSRWRHQMETFSASLALCVGNSPITGKFPAQRPMTWGFDVFFDLRLNEQLSKQSWGLYFDTPRRPLWRHCNVSACQSVPWFRIWYISYCSPCKFNIRVHIEAIHCLKLILVFLVFKHHSSW